MPGAGFSPRSSAKESGTEERYGENRTAQIHPDVGGTRLDGCAEGTPLSIQEVQGAPGNRTRVFVWKDGHSCTALCSRCVCVDDGTMFLRCTFSLQAYSSANAAPLT